MSKDEELASILKALEKTNAIVAESAKAIRSNTARAREQSQQMDKIIEILATYENVDLLDIMNRFVTALEQRRKAIVIIDHQYLIIWVNPAARSMFGYGGELIGKQLGVLIPDRYRQIHRKHFDRFIVDADSMRLMGERGVEIWGVTKHGAEIPVNVAIGKQLGMLVAIIEERE